REYSIDPRERLFVKDIMATKIIKIETGTKLNDAAAILENNSKKRYQRLIPVIQKNKMIGVVPWQDILEKANDKSSNADINDIIIEHPAVVYPDETLHEVSDRMAYNQVGAMPVVSRDDKQNLVGLITQYKLLAGETHEIN